MRFIHFITVFIIAMIINVIGGLFKILHWPYAALMLIIGSFLLIISFILFLVKLYIDDKKS